MKRKPLLIISICTVFGIGCVLMLFFLSNNDIHERNSFIRIFPPVPVIENKVLDVQYNSYYIAGGSKDYFYLGNSTAPLHLLVINTASSDSQHIKLNIEKAGGLNFKSVNVKVSEPYFYIADGTIPAIFRGKLNEWRADRFMYDSAYFVDLIPMSSNTFAIRSLNAFSREYNLGKETNVPPYVKLFPTILEKQVDGIFCTDGMLHYDKDLTSLVYIYHYRNQYIRLDTNFNLLYRGQTIDTTSKAKVKVAKIISDNTYALASPPLMVNKKSSVSNNFLFVNSTLLAKNEDRELFDRSSVIDVYDLNSGEYKFSFYLSDYGKAKMKDFRVFDNSLVALFDHHVVTYNLVSKYFVQN